MRKTRHAQQTLVASAGKRIRGAVVKFAYARTIDTVLLHFEHGAEQKICWHNLDGVANSFGGGLETTVAEGPITLLAAGRK